MSHNDCVSSVIQSMVSHGELPFKRFQKKCLVILSYSNEMSLFGG